MKGIFILLWYAVWGMYQGMVEKKTPLERFVLIVIAVLIILFAGFSIPSMLPGIGLLLLFFLRIAIVRAIERKEENERE